MLGFDETKQIFASRRLPCPSLRYLEVFLLLKRHDLMARVSPVASSLLNLRASCNVKSEIA